MIVDVEMPNSKSWVKLAVAILDPNGRVRELAIHTPIRLGDFPWTWDFGTPNGTYGAFRDETGSVILTQTIDPEGSSSWLVRSGPVGEERPYERSAPGVSQVVRGWAHLQNEDQAVAFAVEGIGGTPGRLTAAIRGAGGVSFRFAPTGPMREHSLSLYEHFVSTPVPIGAATSPASILSPLEVRVDPLP